MSEAKKSPRSSSSRRDFLKASALATGAAMGTFPVVNVLAQETKRKFKVALIGCGGRGNGALGNHIEAAQWLNETHGWGLQIEPVATGDWFEGKAKGAGKRYNVPEDKCFSGGDCYLKVLEQKPDIVVMAQPPVFRPRQFEACIEAGTHVFTEKPVGVDPPGIRQFLAAGEKAKEKGLRIAAGTQRRHSEGYNRTALEIKDGAYGRVMAGRVAWNMGKIFTNTPINPTSPDQLCGPWQIWVEMSGDHIVEQHVHNLDIANWYIGAHPVSAGGFGFRARRVAGNMYDFFSGDVEYPGGVYVHSMCRQIGDCWNWVGEQFTYERNKPGDFEIQSKDPYAECGYHKNAYVAEHAHLLWAIVKGEELNEAQNVAWATATAILIREAAYTGKRIKWSEMFEDPKGAYYNLQLKPTAADFETDNVTMLKDGDIRIPGV